MFCDELGANEVAGMKQSFSRNVSTLSQLHVSNQPTPIELSLSPSLVPEVAPIFCETQRQTVATCAMDADRADARTATALPYSVSAPSSASAIGAG